MSCGSQICCFRVVVVPQVLAQWIGTEVALRVAPYGVNVVGAALGVVVLREKVWPLEPVIVGFSRTMGTCPGEVDLQETLAGELGRLPICQGVRQSVEVHVEKCPQRHPLRSVELRGGNTAGSLPDSVRTVICGSQTCPLRGRYPRALHPRPVAVEFGSGAPERGGSGSGPTRHNPWQVTGDDVDGCLLTDGRDTDLVGRE